MATSSNSAPDPSSPPPPVRWAELRRLTLLGVGIFLAFAFFDAALKAILLFFVAFLLAVVLNVPVRALERRGVPRGASAAGVAVIEVGGLAAVVYFGTLAVRRSPIRPPDWRRPCRSAWSVWKRVWMRRRSSIRPCAI